MTAPHAVPPKTSQAQPFIKWVGGKRSLLGDLLPRCPTNFNRYYELFLGGGALYYALRAKHPQMKASLSDINPRLINAYRQVAANPHQFAAHLEKLLSSHTEEQYYRVRQHSLDEGIDDGGDTERAARFVYLNKTGFNGLYRENSTGKFNVPVGQRKGIPRCDLDLILATSEALNLASIRTRSHTFIRPRPGDFLYFDPPYDGTFTAYTSHTFSEKNQQILAQQCRRLADKGCYVMASNADTPMIRDLYQGFYFHEVMAPRSVNSRGEGRQKVQELIICSYTV